MSKDSKQMPSKADTGIAGVASRVASYLRRYRLRGMLDLTSPPDAGSLLEVLEVEKRASIDGKTNLPSSSEDVLTGFQKEIVDYHRKLQDAARGKVRKLAARVLATARRVNPSAVMERLRDIPSKCQNSIDRILADSSSKLDLLRAQEVYERQCLDAGEEQSKEEDSGRFVLKAISFLMMLGTIGAGALALGSNFMMGPDAGSLLSTDPAIAIAVLAVVAPFLVAVGASNSESGQRDFDRPTFRAVILLTVVFLELFACFCAHLIIVSSDTATFTTTEIVAALSAMTSNPGAIGADFDALKGLGIVMAIGLVGLLLGNQIVSTNVEVGGPRATLLRASKEREEFTRQLRKQINQTVDLAEKDVDRSVKRLRKNFMKLSRLAERANETQAHYDDFMAGLEESCNLLLERYREINIAERDTGIPPSFSEQICFRMEGASRISFFDEGIERLRKSELEMQDFSDRVSEIRRDLRDLNRDTIRSLDAAELHEEADQTNAFSTAQPAIG